MHCDAIKELLMFGEPEKWGNGPGWRVGGVSAARRRRVGGASATSRWRVGGTSMARVRRFGGASAAQKVRFPERIMTERKYGIMIS